MEQIIELYDNLVPPNPPEVINEAWENLQTLYQQKSIIQLLFSIFDSSENPFHKFHAISGIHSSLIQSFIHYNIEELCIIQSTIVDLYLKEQNDFFKSKCVDIICFLLNQTKKSWPRLDDVIFNHPPSIFKYFKLLFYYSLYSTSLDLILLKTSQAFECNLHTQLEALEIFFYFNKNLKNIENFKEQISQLVTQVFSSNDVPLFNYFCQVFAQFFQQMYPFCPLLAFTSNLTNLELHPSILFSIRDFLNYHISYFFNIECDQMSEEEKDEFCQKILMEILAAEAQLSNHLYSIEFDDSVQNTDSFMQLFKFIPKEPIEAMLSELINVSDLATVLTALSLFEPFIKTYGGDENCYTFLMNCLSSDNPLLIKMAIESLYETRSELEPFLQPDLIAFLMKHIQDLYSSESYSEEKYYIVQLLFYIFTFSQQIEDIYELIGPLFEFGVSILKNDAENEIIEILNLFNYLIMNYFEISATFCPRLIELLLSIIDQKVGSEDDDDEGNIVALSFSCLMSILYKNHSIFESYIPLFIENIKDDVSSFRFLVSLLAFYPEIVKGPIESNLERIISICIEQSNCPLRIIAGLETAVTIFSFFEGKIDTIQPIFEILFKAIQTIPYEMNSRFLLIIEIFFKQLSLIQFPIDSIYLQMIELLGESIQGDTLVLHSVSSFANMYRSNNLILDLTPFFEYILNQIEKILQQKKNKKINQFEPILIVFWNFFNDNIDLMPSDEFCLKISHFFFKMLSETDVLMITLFSIKMLLACEKKINLQDEKVFQKIVEILQYEDDHFYNENRKQILTEIKCVASKLLYLMISKNPESIQIYIDPILTTAINELKECNDQELSEALIALIITILPPENQEPSLIQLILSHFPILIDNQFYELSYKWLLLHIPTFSEEEAVIAHKSFVRFMIENIQEFHQNKYLSVEILSAFFQLANTISQEFVVSSLNNEDDINSYLENIKYLASLFETSSFPTS